MDGKLVKNLRGQSGLSIDELASISNLNPNIISKIESDEHEMDTEVIETLSSFFATRLDYSYVAGLFDRASVISIMKVRKRDKKTASNSGWVLGNGYMVRVEMNTKYKLLAKLLTKLFSCGSITKVNGHKNSYYKFMAWSSSGEKVLQAIYPYLRIKRKKAELALKLRELQSEHKRGSWGSGPKTQYERPSFVEIQHLANNGYGSTRIAKIYKISLGLANVWVKNVKDGNKAYFDLPRIERKEIESEYKIYEAKAEQLFNEIRKL